MNFFISFSAESLLDLMFSLKNLNFSYVCVRVCVCVHVRVRVRVCVCAYIYACINVTNQNNVTIATCTTQYRVLTKFQKFIN